MKRFELLGFAFAFVAFILKLFHIHYHTWIILASLIILPGVYLYQFVKKGIELDSLFIGLSSVLLLTWLLFLTKFFPMPTIPMGLAFGSLLIGIFFKFKNRSTLADGRQWVNLFLIIICFIIYRMPKDERYYFTGVRFNYEIESDYVTWSKYSWFLYQAGKYDESFAATERALYIANQLRDEFWVQKIIEHQEKIKDRDWNSY